MAELVDALDSKSSSGNGVRVRFPLRVLLMKNNEKPCNLQGFFYCLIPLEYTKYQAINNSQ